MITQIKIIMKWPNPTLDTMTVSINNCISLYNNSTGFEFILIKYLLVHYTRSNIIKTADKYQTALKLNFQSCVLPLYLMITQLKIAHDY